MRKSKNRRNGVCLLSHCVHCFFQLCLGVPGMCVCVFVTFVCAWECVTVADPGGFRRFQNLFRTYSSCSGSPDCCLQKLFFTLDACKKTS